MFTKKCILVIIYLVVLIVLGIIAKSIGLIKISEASATPILWQNSAIWEALDTTQVLRTTPKQTEIEKLEKSIALMRQKLFVLQLILYYSDKFNVNPNLALSVAQCESGLNPKAKSNLSTATGIYQFIKSTFKANCEGVADDPEYNVKCAIKMISQGKINHWNASRSCWLRSYLSLK